MDFGLLLSLAVSTRFAHAC